MRSLSALIANRCSLRQLRRLFLSFIALTLVSVNAVPNLVTATSTKPQPVLPMVSTLTGTFQVVNNGIGDQTGPDVDCNVTAYTSPDDLGSSLIHYVTAPATTASIIPGNALDSGPRVGGNRIAFTEFTPTGDAVVVFNVSTLFRTDIPGAKRSHPAVAGDLVAYEDRSFFVGPNLSELGVYDLSTETDIRLTDDTLFDKNASVSPTGNAVVWEKCQTDGLGCNIYSAIQTAPGEFTSRALTSAAGENRRPDTNGQIAVYFSDRSGENDIYLQPLAGGAETRIAIPGDQRDLSISGNLIAFESQVGFEYDIFVYDLSTGTLYQVTNTAGDEFESRISFCNGVGRIVYTAPAVDFDIYSFTFQLPTSPSPPSPATQINDLIALVRSLGLLPALENSLVTKLQDALAAVNATDKATACSSLTSFISKVQSQSDRKITAEDKSRLINSANEIKRNLGCL